MGVGGQDERTHSNLRDYLMKKDSKNKTEKPVSDEELKAIMDKRVQEELKKFITNPPKPLSKEQEDGIRRRNEDGWNEGSF